MTVRVGIIGCGAIARRSHIPALKALDGAEVVAFASRSLASAQAAADDNGGGRTFDDWRKIVEADDIDAVVVCSPNALHAEQSIAATASGKHVLVEKPMACTVEQADAMIAATGDNGVILQVAHNMRYVPGIIASRDAVAGGAVGEVVAVRSAFGHSGPHSWAPDSTWFFDAALSGGGALIDLGIHIIDVVRFVTGLDAAEVSAMTFENTDAGAVEDAAEVLVRFTNKAVGFVHASWITRPAPDFALMVFGTDGILRLDTRGPVVRAATGAESKLELPQVASNPCAEFVGSIEHSSSPTYAASPHDARAALAIVCAAYEAARTGRTTVVT